VIPVRTERDFIRPRAPKSPTGRADTRWSTPPTPTVEPIRHECPRTKVVAAVRRRSRCRHRQTARHDDDTRWPTTSKRHVTEC